MTSEDLYAAFRSEMSDTVEPYLWTPTEALQYLDDAQKMFCRLTNGIEDSRTAAITQITTVAAQEYYPLSPLVLRTRLATRGDTGLDVPVCNVENIGDYGIRFNGQTGALKVLIAGMSANALRAWPIPDEVVSISLAVYRLPLRAIDDFDAPLEIDEQHHRHLLLWAKHLAYDKQDAETRDSDKSVDYENRFRAYCKKAKAEQTRARRVTSGVAYGGI